MLIIEILTIGRETFLPSTSFFKFLRAMKYSKFNPFFFRVRSYAKLLCFKSVLVIFLCSCGFQVQQQTGSKSRVSNESPNDSSSLVLRLANERLELYLPLLQNKRVALVGNQTSCIGNTHLVDTLLSRGIRLTKVFAPEHGFRGDADAGEHLANGKDEKTGLPLISLYGKNKKPSPEQLKEVDVVVFDIQDVGVRFYTYISTLHYVMEACAEQNIPLIVLDRPNPNGHYIDGPLLEKKQQSFVGMHPVPVVYGMTIGEYAQMINGESWLAKKDSCELTVIPCENYRHDLPYALPIAPSPNLRSTQSIALYPSLCLFEGTTVSVGRGTEHPFEWFGHPKFPKTDFSFTPTSSYGSKHPLWENVTCYGLDLRASDSVTSSQFNLVWLIWAKEQLGAKKNFIDKPDFFDKLAGTDQLRLMLEANESMEAIRATWEADLGAFKKVRANYLLYP